MIDYETSQSLVAIIGLCLIMKAGVFFAISATTENKQPIHPVWMIATVMLTTMTTASVAQELLRTSMKVGSIESLAAIAGIWLALNEVSKNAWKSINKHKGN